MNENSPYIPYGKQTISEEDIDAVNRVLRSPYLTQGKWFLILNSL